MGRASQALGASREFFFPVPRALKSAATLSLSYEAATSFENQRSIEIFIGERSLLLKPLSGMHERDVLRIPLDRLDTASGFVRIAVRYGRVMSDDRCVDMRYAGDHLTILPETALELAFDRNAVDTVADALALMPRDVAIYLPGRELSTGEFGAAIEMARALRETGRRTRFETLPGADAVAAIGQSGARQNLLALAFTPRLPGAFAPPPPAPALGEAAPLWTSGAIVIGAADDLTALAGAMRGPLFRGDAKPGALASALTLVNVGMGPAVLVSGADPQSAARLAASAWRSAAVKSVISTDGAPLQLASDRPYTFDRLQTDLAARDVIDRAQWSVALGARDLPFGRRLAALRLNVAVAPDEARTNAVVTAFFNETMMESVSTGADMRAQLAFDVPPGLAGLRNSLRVVVQRQPQGGDCATVPTGYPAQLLGSSQIVTRDASELPRDFFEIASQFSSGATLFVESPNAFAQRANLAALTELAVNLVPPLAPLAIRFIESDTAPMSDGPFIALTSQAPVNAAPPVRFDQGRAVIRRADGKTVADIGGLRETAIAQLVKAGFNDGLWIRPAAPGETIAPPERLQLDRGNVAIIDKTGVAFAFSTERDRLVEVIYPDRVSLADIAGAYRPWVVGALWLAFSLLVVASVHRFYGRGRMRRPL